MQQSGREDRLNLRNTHHHPINSARRWGESTEILHSARVFSVNRDNELRVMID